MRKKLLHFGCGTSYADEWTNLDGSPNLRLQRIPIIGSFIKLNSTQFPNQVSYHNIVNQKLPEEHFSHVYSSHVLEHLSQADLKKCLKNVYDSMETGAVFRSVMPDLAYYISQYSALNDADVFNRDTMFGQIESSSFKQRIKMSFGNSSHKWLHDFESISDKLELAGFRDIRRAQFNDSDFAEFKAVEHKPRWLNALGFECLK